MNHNFKGLIINSERCFYYSSLIYLTIYCLPIVIGITGRLRSIIELLPYIFFLCGMVLLRDKKRKRKIWAVLFVAVVFDTFLYYAAWTTNTSFSSKQYAMISFWFPVVLLIYWSKGSNVILLQRLGDYYVFLLVITAITTIIFERIYPLAARQLAGEADYNLTMFYFSRNIGGYGFVYGMIFAIPFILANSNRIVNKLRFIILALFMLCAVETEYLFAIIFGIIIVLNELYIVIKEKSSIFRLIVRILMIIMVIMIVLLITFGVRRIALFIDDLSHASWIHDSELFYERVIGVRDLLLGKMQANDVSTRIDKYSISWNSFLVNPLIGSTMNGGNRIGGHAELLDTLASTGLIGACMCFYIILKGIKQLQTSVDKNIFVQSSGLLLITLAFSLVNTVFYCPMIMFDLFVCPIILHYQLFYEERY